LTLTETRPFEKNPGDAWGVIADFALPDPNDLPACFLCQESGPLVTLGVPAHLLFPQLGVRSGPRLLAAVNGTAVPEAAVDEHRQPTARQDNVGRAPLGKLAVEAKSPASSVDGFAQCDLW
jgi:hypothetical protein